MTVISLIQPWRGSTLIPVNALKIDRDVSLAHHLLAASKISTSTPLMSASISSLHVNRSTLSLVEKASSHYIYSQTGSYDCGMFTTLNALAVSTTTIKKQ